MAKRATYDAVSNPFLQSGDAEGDLYILFAGHSRTKPGHQIGPRVFDYYLIHTILSGKGSFECDGRRTELAAGDSFVIEPGKLVTYKADMDDPWLYRWVAVKGPRVGRMLERCGIDWANPVVPGGMDGVQDREAAGPFREPHVPAEARQGNRYRSGEPAGEPDMPDRRASARRPSPSRWIERMEAVFRERKPGGALEAEGYFCLLLSGFESLLKPKSRQDPHELTRVERHMRQAAEQLTAQFAEPIRIEKLAEQFGYNRSYFSKMFKQVNRTSPVAFLASLRVGKARQMLRERPDLSVEQIAYSVGFRDPLYFSKQFKKHYGLSPSGYRQSLVRQENRLY